MQQTHGKKYVGKDTINVYANGNDICDDYGLLYEKKKGDTLYVIGSITHDFERNINYDTTFVKQIYKDGLIQSGKGFPFFVEEKYKYNEKRQLIAAHNDGKDVFDYKFVWKGNLLTDVYAIGGYYSDSIHSHIVYDTSTTCINGGIIAFLDGAAGSVFGPQEPLCYLLSGHMGPIPNYRVVRIENTIYSLLRGNLYYSYTAHINSKVDSRDRLSSYNIINVKDSVSMERKFYYPN